MFVQKISVCLYAYKVIFIRIPVLIIVKVEIMTVICEINNAINNFFDTHHYLN